MSLSANEDDGRLAALTGTPGYFFSIAQPKQGVENKAVLRVILKGEGKGCVGLVLVIHVVVAHIHVEHPVVHVGPGYRIIATVPDFGRFGTGSQWEATRVDGQQDFNSRVAAQIILPAVPFIGS